MDTRVSAATLLFLAVAAAVAAVAYIVYPEGEPPAYDVAAPLTGEVDAPLEGLVRAVSRSAYELGYVRVEGEPIVSAGHMHMKLVEVAGYLVMPAPGYWRAESGEVLSHMQVMQLLSKASYVAVEGRPAEAYMPWLGRVNMLVAYSMELVVDGKKVELSYEGPPREGDWRGEPPRGHGMPGMADWVEGGGHGWREP